MEKVRFFCEGYSDQRFLRDFIEMNYGISITDKDLKDNKFIHCLEGWTNLSNLETKITEEFSEYTSLIFLDADDKNTVGKAGLEETIKFVDELMDRWKWTNYDKFIFPNNTEKEGEVEDFLERVINPKNSDIFECWNGFEDCLTKKGKAYNIPAKKSKIYLYHEVLHGSMSAEKEKCKDKGRNFKDGNLWELDVEKNEYLKALKEFLDKYLL